MTNRAALRPIPLLLMTVATVACGSDAIAPDPEPATGCAAAGGVTHTGTIASTAWRTADNPHSVPGPLSITGTLSIEPGVLICAGANAAITLTSPDATIDARGTAAAPIVFTAADPAEPWAGIHASVACATAPCTAAEGVISNARIEYARQGIVAGDFVRVDSVHFRHIRCTAARVVHIARSVVDSAGQDGCPAVEIGIAASRGGIDTFEDVVIRGSGGDGLRVQAFGPGGGGSATGSVEILGGRIEGSAGVGLRFSMLYREGNVSAARPVRIVGSGNEPVWAPLEAVAMIWPTIGAQNDLRGNAADTAVIWGNLVGVSEVVLGGTVVWQPRTALVEFGIRWGDDVEVRLEAGSRLDLRNDLISTGRFVARGTSNSPVTITGAGVIRLECDPIGGGCNHGSRMVNTRLDGVHFVSHQYTVLDSVHARRVRLVIGGPASRVTNITVEDALGPAFDLYSDVRVSNCAVRNNAFYGIIVYESAANATIHNCDFEANRNAGVWNVGNAPLDARFNWWGDEQGPFGSNGDGVQGSVNYEPFLQAPPEAGVNLWY
ncbi:MAG: right-handed parallel beta-helix repeat-containing protein [Gemmatimonadetes bacterium]|nr:right-handed parallel beta-helix repeat-containing protein [Gemmatimonadota bacterium]